MFVILANFDSFETYEETLEFLGDILMEQLIYTV